MNEELAKSLRGVVFGGYDRESVLICIRGILEQNKEQCAQLQTELDKLQAVNNTLAEQNRQMYDQYHQMSQTLTGQNKNIETLATQVGEQTKELDKYRAKEELLERTTEDAQRKLEEAERQTEEMLTRARWEQDKLTREATKTRLETVRAAEGQLMDIRELTRQLGALLDGVKYATEEVG